MNQPVGRGPKRLVAVLALVVPLAGVDTSVYVKRIAPSKLLTTEFAFEVFL